MAQKPIELILLRQLASRLSVPMTIVDHDGTVIYFNEPAEALLGRRFEESEEMPFSEWTTIFAPHDRAGNPIPPESLPLALAVLDRQPAHGELSIVGLDGAVHSIEVTAFPVEGARGHLLGAVAMFWES